MAQRIVIVGSGNVAYHLGRALFNAGHAIEQVCARNAATGPILAELCNAGHIADPARIIDDADLYLLAVSDDAVGPVSKTLPDHGGIVVHTSGMSPTRAIHSSGRARGVLYPYQTLTRDATVNMREVPLLVTADDVTAEAGLLELARDLTLTARCVSDRDRQRYHVAAVVLNNFMNHLAALSHDVLDAQGLDHDLLDPLLGETFRKLRAFDPHRVQTGPARRGDERTIRAHRDLLADHPEVLDVYDALTHSIRSMYET